MQTNAYDAEYGHSGAAFVNVSTRAGTNDIHGTLYWFFRNDNLNANSFFNNRLTLNLGIRFEKEAPTTDRFNRGNAGYDFNITSPIEPAAQANYARNPIPELAQWNVRGGLRFLATDGAPRGHLAWNTTHFASPNTNVTNQNFGRITGTFLKPPEIQLAARISF